MGFAGFRRRHRGKRFTAPSRGRAENGKMSLRDPVFARLSAGALSVYSNLCP